MITKTNYQTEIKKIGVNNLPPVFQKLHDMTTEAIDTNSKDDDVNRVVNSYLEKLNAWAVKNADADFMKKHVIVTKMPSSKKDKVIKDIKKAVKETMPGAKVVEISPGRNSNKNDNVYIDKQRNKFVVIDMATKSKWANENFEDKGEAEDFIKQNNLILNNKPSSKKVKAKILRSDAYDRDIYKGDNGEFYVDVDGKPYTMTEQGEPNYPAKNVVYVTSSVKAPKVKEGKAVETILPEVTFIKSYANLHGKNIEHKRALNLLMALQKAISEKKIRAGSKYADEIINVQEGLTKICNAIRPGETIPIDLDDKARAHYLSIAKSEYKMMEVGLLKRFISLGYKKRNDLVRGVKVEVHATKLLNDIKKVLDFEPHYEEQLKEAAKSLQTFIDGNTPKNYIELPERDLNGLGSIGEAIAGGAVGAIVQYWIHRKLRHEDKVELAGVHNKAIKGSRKNNDNTFSSKNYKRKKDWSGHGAWHGGLKGVEDFGASKKPSIPAIMTVNQVKQQSFRTLGIQGVWKNVIGDIAPPTSIMFTGIGGSGKSTAALKLCETLDQLGQNCLYIAGEQFNSPTFTDLLNRINLKVNRMVIAKDLSSLNQGHFNAVAIDSKDSFNLSVEDYRNLKKRYPHLMWIVISQGIIETKNGKTWTGDEAWRNEMETILNVSNGTVSQTGKNRWGGKGTMKVY